MTDPAPVPAPAPAPAPSKYVPPATQEEFDEIFERRLVREKNKLHSQYSDYDDLKTKAARADQLEHDLASDSEKAVREAREAARKEVLAEATPRVVRSEFKAAAKGVLTEEQLTALLEDLDLSKYVTDKGDVDEEKVSKKVAAFAPAGNGNGKTPPRALGQGKQPGMQAQPGDQGRAMAEKRFGSKK